MQKYYSGKARDMYMTDDENLVMVATDRISVHKVLPYEVKNKGTVLNKLSEFWFNKYADLIPNHMITTEQEKMQVFFSQEKFAGRCMLVKYVNMFRVECIVRGHMTGTCYENYKNNKPICGITLPPNLQLSEKLEHPIFTPTSKEDDVSDAELTFEEFVSIVGEDYANRIRDISVKIYEDAYAYLLTKGIILADTKMEFGFDDDGNLVLADELLTPDSSRFWSKENFRVGTSQTTFDREELKDYIEDNAKRGIDVRNNIPKEILERVSLKYSQIYTIITGQTLE